MLPHFRNNSGELRVGRKFSSNISLRPFINPDNYNSDTIVIPTGSGTTVIPLNAKIGAFNVIMSLSVSTDLALAPSTFLVEIWKGPLDTGTLLFIESARTESNLQAFVNRQIKIDTPLAGDLSGEMNIRITRNGSIRLSANVTTYLMEGVPPADLGFTPPNAANLQYWFAGNGNVFSNVDGTLAQDNDPVFAWQNNGTGADAVQSNPSNRPIYKKNGINGYSYLTSPPGSNNFFQDIAFDVPSGVSTPVNCTVALFCDNIIPADIPGVMGVSGTTTGGKMRLAFLSTAGRQIAFTKSQNSFILGNITNPVLFIARPSAGSTGSPIRYINNGPLTNSNIDVTNLVSTGSSSIEFLRSGPGLNTFTGDIYEILIYNTRLGDAEMLTINDYFTNKYLV